MTESIMNQQTLGMMLLVELASGAFQNTMLQPN
jgi:hypothetical protein